MPLVRKCTEQDARIVQTALETKERTAQDCLLCVHQESEAIQQASSNSQERSGIHDISHMATYLSKQRKLQEQANKQKDSLAAKAHDDMLASTPFGQSIASTSTEAGLVNYNMGGRAGSNELATGFTAADFQTALHDLSADVEPEAEDGHPAADHQPHSSTHILDITAAASGTKAGTAVVAGIKTNVVTIETRRLDFKRSFHALITSQEAQFMEAGGAADLRFISFDYAAEVLATAAVRGDKVGTIFWSINNGVSSPAAAQQPTDRWQDIYTTAPAVNLQTVFKKHGSIPWEQVVRRIQKKPAGQGGCCQQRSR